MAEPESSPDVPEQVSEAKPDAPDQVSPGWRPFKNPEWWIVVLTAATVLLTLALAVVTYLSLGVIRGQLSEMGSASEQTDRMIGIANKQSEAALKTRMGGSGICTH